MVGMGTGEEGEAVSGEGDDEDEGDNEDDDDDDEGESWFRWGGIPSLPFAKENMLTKSTNRLMLEKIIM